MSSQFTLQGTSGETFTAVHYGSLGEAHAYFQARLHERAWTAATPTDRQRALYAATVIIDTLNFKGDKHSVWELKQNSSSPADAELRSANSAQELEFPRGSDTEEPRDIRLACYEIAHSLLDGKDPELELEALSITSNGFSSVRTTYNRAAVPIEHIINGVPNPAAWRLLRPFLRDGDAIRLARLS